MYISEKIKYIGVDDNEIDLFEGQYKVPFGVSYNSYVILDDKIAVMDTVDASKTGEWLENLRTALGGRKPDYLVISHLEPDHAGNVGAFFEAYPDCRAVVNAKSLAMSAQFLTKPLANPLTVKEGDELNLGEHILVFVMAPMVHWPEVMVEYERTEKILFSADGFGTFGALEKNIEWIDEARRYYINIVGKYGASVQTLLKKAAALDIAKICPLHGPVLDENLSYYIEKYNIWSSYKPENEGVLTAYSSLHGNTAAAARRLADKISERGVTVVTMDLARCDMSRAVENAFRYDRLVVAAPTYDAALPASMETFLSTLKKKGYRQRKAAIVENGSWAPMAAKLMRAYLEAMPDVTICDKTITIKSTLKQAQESELDELADELTK